MVSIFFFFQNLHFLLKFFIKLNLLLLSNKNLQTYHHLINLHQILIFGTDFFFEKKDFKDFVVYNNNYLVILVKEESLSFREVIVSFGEISKSIIPVFVLAYFIK